VSESAKKRIRESTCKRKCAPEDSRNDERPVQYQRTWVDRRNCEVGVNRKERRYVRLSVSNGNQMISFGKDFVSARERKGIRGGAHLCIVACKQLLQCQLQITSQTVFFAVELMRKAHLFDFEFESPITGWQDQLVTQIV